MTAPTPQQLLSLQQTLYRSTNPTRRWLHCQRRDWVLAQIAEAGDTPARALEVGPGSGLYLPALAAVAAEVVAADIEDAFLAEAAAIGNTLPALRCVRDDITATGLPAAAFDLILCTEVLEHIADSGGALRGLASLLAPGGTLLLTTPQRYSPLELCARVAFLPGIGWLTRRLYSEPVLELGHINVHTQASLQRQLATAGLQIQAQYKCGFYLPVVAELCGQRGQRGLAWCERRLRDSSWSGLLWTQCYRLQRRP